MKTLIKLMLPFLFLTTSSCKKDTTGFIKYHPSHEKNRQNVPFSDAVQVENIYFLTGQIGKNHATGKLVEGGIKAETAQTLKNIEAVLNNHHLNLNDIVKCTVILGDINDFDEMNQVYRTFFSDHLPARTTFGANLVRNARVEIEVVAVKK